LHIFFLSFGIKIEIIYEGMKIFNGFNLFGLQ
jgi:hypothetical protein